MDPGIASNVAKERLMRYVPFRGTYLNERQVASGVQSRPRKRQSGTLDSTFRNRYLELSMASQILTALLQSFHATEVQVNLLAHMAFPALSSHGRPDLSRGKNGIQLILSTHDGFAIPATFAWSFSPQRKNRRKVPRKRRRTKYSGQWIK